MRTAMSLQRRPAVRRASNSGEFLRRPRPVWSPTGERKIDIAVVHNSTPSAFAADAQCPADLFPVGSIDPHTYDRHHGDCSTSVSHRFRRPFGGLNLWCIICQTKR